MAQNALIVKGRFQFKGTGLYGIMALIFDVNKKILIEDYIYVSRFSEIFLNDIKSPWHTLEIQLNRIQMQGTYAASITMEFQRSLRERLDPNYGIATGILVDYELRNREKIYSTIEEMLTFVQKDKNISLEVAFEQSDLEAIMAARTSRIEDEAQHMAEEEKLAVAAPPVTLGGQDILIPANPILSPIKGVPSSELALGMQLLMRLDLSLPQGHYWADIFRAVNPSTKEVLPLIATVVQLGPIINKCRDVVVGYGGGRVTRFNVESAIKLKTYEVLSQEQVVHPHLIDTPMPQETKETKRMEDFFFQSILPWVIFGTIALFAVVLIFILAFNF